jgi:hypothetical protein
MENKQIILTIGMIVLMVVFFTSNNKIVELATGIPLLIILIWSMIAIQQSNIDSKMKRNSLITVIVILSVIGRLYFQIMN